MSIPILVTVDLGWPWWVTTAIALGIAASSALGLVFLRDGFLRGVVATLVLEGVVIAAIAPAVMGSAGGSASAMSAAKPLTRAEFARQADANCRALSRQLAPLGSPKTLPGIAHKLDVVMPKFWAALRRQGALRPPAGEAGVANKWMQAMARYSHEVDAVRAAATSGDAAAVRRANARVGAVGAEAARLSKQLGLTYCFQ